MQFFSSFWDAIHPRSENNSRFVTVISSHGLVVLSALTTFLILGWLLRYSAYGIDFTDEGFYLVWISNPFIYDTSLTQFGFVYHPLYNLLHGDIAAFRRVNIVIIFCLAWCLSYLFLSSFSSESVKDRVVLHTVAAGLSTAAFISFGVNCWVMMPSYNSLAFQALLITGIGLLLSDNNVTRKSIAGWIIIGVGGWLAFMAKPSTALALTVGVLIYLLISRKFPIRLVLISIISALVLLLFSALLIDGSISGFVQRLRLSIEFGEYLGGGYTLSHILRIDDFQLAEDNKGALFFIFLATFLALWSTKSELKIGRLFSLLASFGFFVLTGLLVFGVFHRVPGFGGYFQGLLISGIVFAAILFGLVLGRLRALKAISAEQWGIAFLFFVMPYIYAFGSNNNYWRVEPVAAVFWVLAGLTLIGPMARERASWCFILPLVLATQTVTAALLQSGFEHPYRQPEPLRLNTTVVEVGAQRSSLVLSKNYADYIANAVSSAREAGFTSGNPMIDLSGQSPGILYALGAESIGQAWTIGRYPGSLKLAKAMHQRVPCKKIAAAWVLFEPKGPRSIPTDLMSSLGATFPEKFERVGSWQTAKGAGGFTAIRQQELYKPLAPNETLKACLALRERNVE